jgi:hypothetical protein
MSHIPEHHLLPQDMVDVYDLGDGTATVVKKLRMHASDARHAMAVNPDRYKLFAPQSKPAPEPPSDPVALLRRKRDA